MVVFCSFCSTSHNMVVISLLVDSFSLRSELLTYFITMNSLCQLYYYSISDILAFEWRIKHMFLFSFSPFHPWFASHGFASFVDCKSQNETNKLNARTFFDHKWEKWQNEATIQKKRLEKAIERTKKKMWEKKGEKNGTDEMKIIIMNLIEWWKTHNIHTN